MNVTVTADYHLGQTREQMDANLTFAADTPELSHILISVEQVTVRGDMHVDVFTLLPEGNEEGLATLLHNIADHLVADAADTEGEAR